MKPPTFSKTTLLHGTIALAIILASLVLWRAARENAQQASARVAPTVASSPVPAVVSPGSSPSPADSAPVPVQPAVAAPAKPFEDFRLKPFAVARSSDAHEWTAEDAKSPDAILDLAHNEMEVQRLMEENGRIEGRQLVYRKEPVFQVVQRARAAGEPVRRLMLPGLDGREVEVEVDRADLDPSGLRGTFTGRLPGRGQSMVTLAFKEGREAFTVMSPDDGTFLQGSPREPGEVIVVSFDPEKYQPMPGGEPIKPTK